MPSTAPYVTCITRDLDEPVDTSCFPGHLPFVADLHFDFRSPVTFFVGENGSGKSTLLETIAVLAGFPMSGGGTNDIGSGHGLNEQCPLADLMRVGFTTRPKDGYFFRAELQAHFASLLDQRRDDPEFVIRRGVPADPYGQYGGQPLHTMSHGEAFLSVLQNRIESGLFLLDEPESALSPQRQLALLALMHDRVSGGKTQFLIATHSPILMTFPEAEIVSFDSGPLTTITLEETSHHQITTGILSHPEAYWKHLRG